MPPGGEEDGDGGEGCSPPGGDDSEDEGTPGPLRMDAACEAAEGTVSASPTTSRTSEGAFDQIWRMMIASPVPVSRMSFSSCQAVCHVTSPPFADAVREDAGTGHRA